MRQRRKPTTSGWWAEEWRAVRESTDEDNNDVCKQEVISKNHTTAL